MKKITDFKAIFICPDHNEKYHKRKLHMEKLLKNIGFTRIEHFKSGTEDYPKCLTLTYIEILKRNIDEPFIFFEDDVDWTGTYEIDYDNSIDAIYLGISKWGGHPSENIHLGESKFSTYSDSLVRVHNMLSSHSVLYNSRVYKEAVIDLLEKYCHIPYHSDVLISRIQSNFLILATKVPIFYQSSRFNTCGVQDHTLFQIKI
jgi:hypothetical protein